MALSASAADRLTFITFDDDQSPALTAGSDANLDYTHATVVGGTTGKFLNVWANNWSTGPTDVTLPSTELGAAAQWTLEFDFAGYGGCNKKAGTFSLLDTEGNVIFTINDKADWNNTMTVSDGSTINCYACNKSNRLSAATGDALTAKYWYHFTVVGNQEGVKISAAPYNDAAELQEVVISKSQVKGSAATPATIRIQPGSCGAMAIDNLEALVENAVAQSYAYTVKYMCDGAEIKDAASLSDTEGSAIALSAGDKSPIWFGDQKYIYESDDSEGKTVTSDGNTVVTVNFRKALSYFYTISSTNGATLASALGVEGETVVAAYPRYELDEGNLYMASATNKEYRKTILLDEPDKNLEIAYNANKENVVFYSEAEFIEGLTESQYGNVAVRASNANAAYATGDTKITSLPAGKYILYAGVFSSAKSPNFVINFKAGDFEYAAPVTNVNASEVASEEFTLNAETDLMLLPEGMGNNNLLDYIYIQQTGEVVPDMIEEVAAEKKAAVKKYCKNGQLLIETANGTVNVAGARIK